MNCMLQDTHEALMPQGFGPFYLSIAIPRITEKTIALNARATHTSFAPFFQETKTRKFARLQKSANPCKSRLSATLPTKLLRLFSF